MLTVHLLDSNLRLVAKIELHGKAAEKVRWADQVRHAGRFYDFYSLRGDGSANFVEVEAPLDLGEVAGGSGG